MSTQDTKSNVAVPWLRAWTVYARPAALRMSVLGFSAGLPLLLVLGTLGFWLREAGVDRATIGYLSWVGLMYAFKWVWAPVVDRVPVPWLTRMFGRRRSWLLLAQGLVVIGLVQMALHDPGAQLSLVVIGALLAAMGSATQDIALDALRIESAGVDEQAALAAAYQTGYRLAMIWAGAGALWLAAAAQGTQGYDYAAWRFTYLVMAASVGIGTLMVLFVPEPASPVMPPVRGLQAWLRSVLIEPFADFLTRYRWRALLILALIAIYRISDVVMGIMANPFYVDMGYTKAEVASVTKIYGVIMTLAGAFLGGVLALRLGVMRVLMFGAIASAASNLLYAWLVNQGHNMAALVGVISADNLAGGIASSAFVAYLSGLTSVRYSATQYALFSSMMLLLPKFIAGYSGAYVDTWGYSSFFVATAVLGIPVLLLVALAARFSAHEQGSPSA